jgi:hypothetical protein
LMMRTLAFAFAVIMMDPNERNTRNGRRPNWQCQFGLRDVDHANLA